VAKLHGKIELDVIHIYSFQIENRQKWPSPKAPDFLDNILLALLVTNIGIANIPSSNSRTTPSNTTDLSSVTSIPITSPNDLSITSILIHQKGVAALVKVELSHAAETRLDGKYTVAESAVDFTRAVTAGETFAVPVVGGTGDDGCPA
jgi:hypothetical protein